MQPKQIVSSLKDYESHFPNPASDVIQAGNISST